MVSVVDNNQRLNVPDVVIKTEQPKPPIPNLREEQQVTILRNEVTSLAAGFELNQQTWARTAPPVVGPAKEPAARERLCDEMIQSMMAKVPTISSGKIPAKFILETREMALTEIIIAGIFAQNAQALRAQGNIEPSNMPQLM